MITVFGHLKKGVTGQIALWLLDKGRRVYDTTFSEAAGLRRVPSFLFRAVYRNRASKKHSHCTVLLREQTR
ncbi:hypothetical protein RIEGSTA812A_PEG_1093 [invertebrate metagenome]|uniref:Uncharacterized protein n=1 Tax=invertebrate metagenome TaxID=1711999 RepID=A0A484H7M6_9ZZZZ